MLRKWLKIGIGEKQKRANIPFSREILSPEQKSNVTSSPQVFNAQFYPAFRPFPLDPQLNISQHIW